MILCLSSDLDSAVVLVCLACYNKIPHTGWLKHLFSHNFGGWKSKTTAGLFLLRPLSLCYRWPLSHCVLIMVFPLYMLVSVPLSLLIRTPVILD